MGVKYKVKALFNAVIVKPTKFTEPQGNIIVPDIDKKLNETGIIVSVGPGHYTIMGTFIKTTLKVGMKVILPTMGFTRFKHDDVEYYIGKENEILAKL